MKEKFQKMYMTIAGTVAAMSTAKRLQVGAIVVKDDKIISIGFNGTPSGWDNNCETKHIILDKSIKPDFIDEDGTYYALKTKPEVLHAERNSLDKLARGNESGLGSAMVVTHAPCLECAKSIYGAGINEVYYLNEYRTTDGLEFLKKCGVAVFKVEE